MSGDNMEVQINGIPYLPAQPTIGVGVTTRNRADILETTLQHIRKHTPNAKLVVVDDASTQPVQEADFRFTEQAGIARAKNKCLELLDGCEHIFLFDDDCYPIADDWWKPYVESPEPHLMYQFEDRTTRKLGDIKQVYRDDEHVAYTGVRGCMLYVHRSCLDTVGGMDPIFGVWGYEHVDWSNRIHNAGLSSWRYADVVGSDKLIYSLDEHEAVKRSVPTGERQQLVDRNAAICHQRRDEGFAGYVEYREQSDVVITTLFTGVTDPQRGTAWKPDASLLDAWLKSIPGRKVVLHNELTSFPQESAEFLQVAPGINVYFARWLHIYRWLRDNPDVRFVWCTDGTDVEMLREPWEHMEPGKLYVGSEPAVVGIPWMVDNHKAGFLQDFMGENAGKPLLNAGLVGGDRGTVLRFVHALVRAFFDHEATLFHGKDTESLGVGDMAVFNQVAWTGWSDRLVFGPLVNTVFKANERNDYSFFKHK